MKLGILGAGRVGGNLGRRWAAAGHSIRFGVREQKRIADLVAQCGNRTAATDLRNAARFGDVVVLAVPWRALDSVLDAAGDLGGKVVVDCINPVEWKDGKPSIGGHRSVTEEIAERCEGARVVKAFSTLGADLLVNVRFGQTVADAFIAGDDADAKATVTTLAQDVGFEVVDVGDAATARHLEHLAVLWIHLSTQGAVEGQVAFKLLRRP